MKKISQSVVQAIPFPSDLSVKQQLKIVQRLDGLQDKLDAVDALQSATAAELNAMLPTVLDKAFKGES